MTSRRKKTENRKKRKLKELEGVELESNEKMNQTQGGLYGLDESGVGFKTTAKPRAGKN